MRRQILEFAAAIALTLAAILALAHGALANDVMVTGAFARASATPNASAGVAYLTLMNHGASDDRLVAIATPQADMAETHKTTSDDGMTGMAMMEAIDLPAGGAVVMKPGGLHIMLMGLKAPLKKGETLHLDLTFEKAGKLGVDVPVKGVAASGP